MVPVRAVAYSSRTRSPFNNFVVDALRIDEQKAEDIQEGGIEKVRIRSVLTCASR